MEQDLSEQARQYAVLRSGALNHRDAAELNRIVVFAADHYLASFAAVSIIDGQRQLLLARTGTELWETPRSQAFCAVTIQRPGEPLIVPDARRDRRFSGLDTVSKDPFVRFYAGMPIVDRDGYALGALCVANREPLHSELDLTQLMILARETERYLQH